jgi:hypothetical protein
MNLAEALLESSRWARDTMTTVLDSCPGQPLPTAVVSARGLTMADPGG